MKLNELTKLVTKPKKRLGRGIGSGKGKTAGRGSKGQKARGKIPATFTGTPALYKKLPLRRGLGNPKISTKPVLVSLSALDVFEKKSVVDIQKLIDKGIIKSEDAKFGVKILSNGEISKALTIKLPTSKAAKEKIEKVGGKLI